MNERIKELAEQASTHAKKTVHYYMGQFDGLTWEAKIRIVRDLKLAELIVRECIDTAFHRGHPGLEFLLKHFGFEE